MNSPSLHPAAIERPPRLEMVEWLINRRSKSVKLTPSKSSNQDASRAQFVTSAYQEPYSHEKLPYSLHSPYSDSQLASQTETKIPGKYVSYIPKNYSAAMLNNNDNYYRALNMSFDLLEQQAESSNAKSPLGLASNPTLMSAIKSELEHALDRFGFHDISGARYAAFSVYKGRTNDKFQDDKWHFVSSSNTDPLVKDFNKLEYRRCAEDTASIVAHLNDLDKLKYLFLYRAPYPEAYTKKERR